MTRRKIRYLFHTLGIVLLFALLRLLPLSAASALGGFLGRSMGPRLRAHRTAAINLHRAMPELSGDERRTILHRMWDNLGRVATEYPHLNTKEMSRRMHFIGREHIEALKQFDRAPLFISGHFGNWELAPKAAFDAGIPLMLLYRPPNNRYADALICKIRRAYCVDLIGKGKTGAIKMARAIKDKQAIGLLVDQKTNEGVAVPFFGREAMTANAHIHYALKFNLPILPAYIQRRQGAHFDVIVCPPFLPEQTGDKERDTHNALVTINAMLEDWVRADPAQWFWIHTRWPKEINNRL